MKSSVGYGSGGGGSSELKLDVEGLIMTADLPGSNPGQPNQALVKVALVIKDAILSTPNRC